MFKKDEIVLLMALPSESQKLFERAGVEVFYSGIGKVNAAMLATDLIHRKKPKTLINLGTAGSQKFVTHTLVECSGYVQRDMDLSPLGFPHGETPMDKIPGLIKSNRLVGGNVSGICGTGDSFEVGPSKVPCDLVDMEAYAIAKVCKKFETEFVSFKYISDGSDHNAHNDWVANLTPASIKLFEIYSYLVKV